MNILSNLIWQEQFEDLVFDFENEWEEFLNFMQVDKFDLIIMDDKKCFLKDIIKILDKYESITLPFETENAIVDFFIPTNENGQRRERQARSVCKTDKGLGYWKNEAIKAKEKFDKTTKEIEKLIGHKL